MASKSKGLFMAAAAFAASPQGRKLLQQAREYLSRPENRQRAQQLIEQVKSRGKNVRTSSPATDASPSSSSAPLSNGAARTSGLTPGE